MSAGRARVRRAGKRKHGETDERQELVVRGFDDDAAREIMFAGSICALLRECGTGRRSKDSENYQVL